MKKTIATLLIVLVGTVLQMQASKPIPSFQDLVARRANFTEKHHDQDSKPDPKKKRNMIIVCQVAGPNGAPIQIWVYSLDQKDVLGPYVLIDKGTLTVPIDDREWGVLVECDTKVYMSVLTDSGGWQMGN